jgi:hypothetical protein
MLICEYLIKTSEVVGIGPLMMDRKDNPLGTRFTYHFTLFLKNQAPEITSGDEFIASYDTPDEQAEKRARLTKFKTDYQAAKFKVIELIGDAPYRQGMRNVEPPNPDRSTAGFSDDE